MTPSGSASAITTISPPHLLQDKEAAAWTTSAPGRHRAIFLSDMHLGTRMARPDLILAFLDLHVADTVYLVGDIVDNWHPLHRNWRPDHHAVLRRLLALPMTGSRVVFLPGNHDAFFRNYIGTTFGGIEVAREALHHTADGRRFLVTHGDCCDVFAAHAPAMARAGALIETAMRGIDASQRHLLRRLRPQAWGGIENLIHRSQTAIRKLDRFEVRLAELALRRGYDGVICGHFHQPALHDIGGVVYANCGDWAGSNTALVEAGDGTLSLLGNGDATTRALSVRPARTAAPEDALPC
jgi:UDP-2,3-diacylglucosamine pyrophosphatase LpxH